MTIGVIVSPSNDPEPVEGRTRHPEPALVTLSPSKGDHAITLANSCFDRLSMTIGVIVSAPNDPEPVEGRTCHPEPVEG